ncbi:Lrp/AsnC family transcriptional regulator, partial [Candidatus Woesearchaeota archaeon]|nr:Lrp/AsnC family transcriptional regulator [Candidatus Woesearchaeota archaeon]
DARKNSVLISNKLSLASKTVINRIKKLQKRKIIRGFKPLLNLQKAGYNSNLLMIKYHNISSELEDELINYLKMHASVISVVKTLGEWDIEIEIEAEEEKEIRKVEVEIRQKFALLIQQIDSIPLYQSYKKTFFPKFLM